MTELNKCTIGSIGTIPIFVTDIEKAKRFWSEKFSFEIVTSSMYADIPGRDYPVMYDVAPPGAQTRLTLIINEAVYKVKGTAAKAVFLCDDAMSTFSLLKKRGVQVTEPETLPNGIWMSFVDEDDNRFFIRQQL